MRGVGRGVRRVLSRFYRAPARRNMTAEATVVDLRSDTVTQPCAEMRSAMARAAVGDDVYGEDPTVAKLESQTAALLGKEDAVFLPSGTMANLACILSHTNRGDEVVLGRESHIQNWEQGNVASLASCIMKGINTQPDGTFSPEDLRAAISYDDPHVPRTRLVCLENSHGGHSGTAVPARFADAVGAVCAEHNLALHIDGARILNAAVALQVAPAELTRAADTVTMCLSKGLGAPVGSMAAGSAAHMHSVRRWRKALGGGMRQAGVVASAGLLALEGFRENLWRDHEMAQHLSAGLSEISEMSSRARSGSSGVERVAGEKMQAAGYDTESVTGPGRAALFVHEIEVPTNMVVFQVHGLDGEWRGQAGAIAFCEELKRRGVLMFPYGGQGERIRAVTHRHVDAQAIDFVIATVRDTLMKPAMR